MSWGRYELGELIETKKGYAFKSSWYQDIGHPIVKVSDFTDDSIDTNSLVNVPQEIADEYSGYELCEGDVVVQTVGSWPSNPASVVGKCISVPYTAHGALLNQNAVKILPKVGLDTVFLYYLLRSPSFKNYIVNTARGSASQASITLDAIRKFRTTIPSIVTQVRIGSVLKCYDDLIENNRRRIQLLEESTRLLYKEWFVQLRFPGHEHVNIIDGVPEGWEKKPIKDVLTLNYGKALKADLRIPGECPVYGSSGEVGSHNKPLVKAPGIIVGRKGNVGSIFWVSKDYWPIDTVYFINNEESSLYLYHALQKVTFINTDVAVPGLNRNMAYSREIVIPIDRILELFHDEVGPIQKQIEKLTEHNNKLSQARDILLPRLMNGELVV